MHRKPCQMLPWSQLAKKYYKAKTQHTVWSFNMNNQNPNVSSAIVGQFDPIESLDNSKNSWLFEYDRAKNIINFIVQINFPPMPAPQIFNSSIKSDDLDQMINWLSTVKISMTQKHPDNKK